MQLVQRLFFLVSLLRGFGCLVQDGPIHDAQWSPDGAFFIVVAGYMPAKTVLFDAKCKPVFDLGTGPYNIIRWNPQVPALWRSISM